MKRVLWIGGAIALLLLVGVVVAASKIDAESLRAPLRDAAGRALGREVAIGEMGLRLFPRPAVDARDLRVAGAKASDPAFAELDAVRLRVSLWPLLAGKVVVDALELDGPRIRVPLDERGQPVLPGPTRDREPAEPGGAATGESGNAPARPALAVRSLKVRGGEIAYADWTLADLDVDGAIDLDGSGTARVRADVSGAASARGVEVDAAFALDPASLALRELAADLAIADLDAGAGETRLRGPARGRAELGEGWRLELDDAELRVPGAIDKKPGIPMRLSGGLGADFASALASAVDARLGTAELSARLDERRERVTLGDAVVDLAALHPVLDADLPRPTGKVELQGLGARLAGPELFGAARLEAVRIELPEGPVSIDGTVRAAGRSLRLEGARALIGEQPIELTGSYDLDAGSARVESRTAAASLGPLLAVAGIEPDLQGVLDSETRLQLQPARGLEGLGGSGRIDLTDGRIRGFSLLRQVLGELVAIPVLVARAKGKDLSRYEQEEFEQLAGDFTIDAGVLSFPDLILRYRDATAHLRGSVALVRGGALDLKGRVELAPEVDAELGKPQGSPTVIPITRIGGTVSRPRVQLDRDTLARIAMSYVARDEVHDRLEEKLGKGGAEAVEGLLDVLRGR